MGLRFRKSLKIGPFRITASKSGLSYSVGVKGARVTKRADGRTQTTASIPGTGISHVTTTSGAKQPQKKSGRPHDSNTQNRGCLLALVAAVVMALLFVACGALLSG